MVRCLRRVILSACRRSIRDHLTGRAIYTETLAARRLQFWCDPPVYLWYRPRLPRVVLAALRLGLSARCILQSVLTLLKFPPYGSAVILLLPTLFKQFFLLTKECCTHPLGRLSTGTSPEGAPAAAAVRYGRRRAPHRTIEITALGSCPGIHTSPGSVEFRASVPARPPHRIRHGGRAQVRRLWAKKSSSTRRRSRLV